MSMYRKYMEPEYGEAAPEVYIMEPQTMDMDHIQEWRIKSNYESIAEMTKAYQKCRCYKDVMTVHTENVICKFGERHVPLRIYIPDEAKKSKKLRKFKVLIFYHGGGFSMNSIDVYEYVHRYLSFYGNVIVVAPEYHLAPEYKFPYGLNDAYEALVWVEQNIEKYSGDKNSISVCGDSSGGNFAAAVSMMARDRKGPHIEKQILYYPLTTNIEVEITKSEKRYGKGYFLEYKCIENPMAHYFGNEEDKKNLLASPLLSENLRSLPKSCFVSAECDPLLDQGLMYAAKLEDSGVEVEYHILKGMVHGFINWTYGKSFEALDYAVDFLKSI